MCINQSTTSQTKRVLYTKINRQTYGARWNGQRETDWTISGGFRWFTKRIRIGTQTMLIGPIFLVQSNLVSQVLATPRTKLVNGSLTGTDNEFKLGVSTWITEDLNACSSLDKRLYKISPLTWSFSSNHKASKHRVDLNACLFPTITRNAKWFSPTDIIRRTRIPTDSTTFVVLFRCPKVNGRQFRGNNWNLSYPIFGFICILINLPMRI